MAGEGDYVLGTHQKEMERLGLQHRVWRPVVLNCWKNAAVTVGKTVLDVGAGPGYATVDLAEIVGPAGRVVALERSDNFVQAIQQACQTRGLRQVQVEAMDLISDDFPAGQFDFSWCRWVVAFVADPPRLIEKIGAAIKPGGVALFHEYGRYDTWQFFPRLPNQERFRQLVVDTWRESGGEPDAAPMLPELLARNGFRIRSAVPHIFCIRPTDYMWQWPLQFAEVYLPRLREMNRVDDAFIENVRAEFRNAEASSHAFMLTPLVMEIAAEKIG